MKKRTHLIKLKKGKLPSNKVLEEYHRLRKIGISPKIADRLSRVRRKRK